MVQIPAGQIGLVIAQVGASLPVGAKSGVYKPQFGNFLDVESFVNGGGEKGVQRLVLHPATVVPIHPVGFLVITRDTVYGVPIDEKYAALEQKGGLKPESFGLEPVQLEVVRIEPRFLPDGKVVDMIGIVTTFEGPPLPKGAIANRIGDFTDLASLESNPATKDSDLVEAILSVKNEDHNNYQDFQAFLDHGGRIGLQHDPLMYGAYNLNPFLVSVEMVPMLVVNQAKLPFSRPMSVWRPKTRLVSISNSARWCGPGTAASGRSRCAPENTPSIRAATARRSYPRLFSP